MLRHSHLEVSASVIAGATAGEMVGEAVLATTIHVGAGIHHPVMVVTAETMLHPGIVVLADQVLSIPIEMGLAGETEIHVDGMLHHSGILLPDIIRQQHPLLPLLTQKLNPLSESAGKHSTG